MERSCAVGLIFWILLVNFGCVIRAELSSHRLCANKACDEPVSIGKAVKAYFPSEKGMIGVQPNDRVVIYSHPAGTNDKLLGVEVNGVRGYVPRHTIQETQMKKWASEMVEVEPWLRTPSSHSRQPIQPPYSHEWVHGTVQLRKRPSDWHHRYIHTLRQRLENQPQGGATHMEQDPRTATPPSLQGGEAPMEQQVPKPASQPSAALDASGGHRSLFGSTGGSSAQQTTPAPASATGAPSPLPQQSSVDIPTEPPTILEGSTPYPTQPPVLQDPAQHTVQPAPVTEHSSEHDPPDQTPPEMGAVPSPPEVPPARRMPPEAGVTADNETVAQVPSLTDPLVLSEAAVVKEQSDMGAGAPLATEIPMLNQQMLPNQPILSERPVMPDQPSLLSQNMQPNQPIIPENPVLSERPVAPGEPNLSNQPVLPEQPGVPDQPIIPEQLVIPGQPSLPDQPVLSNQPVLPDQPVIPNQPVLPDQPIIPNQPVLPDQPIIPNQPILPDQPSLPDQPVLPDQPSLPDEPVLPDQPMVPDHSAVHGEPEVEQSATPVVSTVEEQSSVLTETAPDLTEQSAETQPPTEPDQAAAAVPDQMAALGLEQMAAQGEGLPQPAAGYYSTSPQPAGASEPDSLGGDSPPAAAVSQPADPTSAAPTPSSGTEEPEPAIAEPEYAPPEADALYTPPDSQEPVRAAYSESVYGESAYGESAYGESAYGAYQQQATEAPSLSEEAAAGMLPGWLWAAVEGSLPLSGGSDDSLRLPVLLSTIGVSLAVLFIGMRLVSQLQVESTLKQTISKLHQRLTVHREEVRVCKTQLETAGKQAEESGSAAQLRAQLQAAAADQTAAEEELEEARHLSSELSQQVAALEQELAQTQLLLEEQMVQQSQPSSPPIDSMVVETVAKLDAELKQQRKKLMGEMDKLKREKKRLMEELSNTKPMIKQLEAKLAAIGENKVSADEEELNRKQMEELTQKHAELTRRCADLTSERDASVQKVAELECEATEARQQQQTTQDQLETLNSEVDVLKTMLKSKGESSENDSEEKIQNLLEGSKLKAQVEKLTKERAKLKEKWKQERELLKKSQANVEEKSSELSQLSERCEKAEVDKFEAESKLDHLEKYFQKKELSFQEEIGVLKSRLNITEGDNSSSHDLVQRLTDEVAQHKATADTFKQEIQDQERSFRAQIQALEKRSHESWVTCRQAERRLEEANREAAQYRALLTKTEEEKHNLVNGQAALQSFNGTGAVSPVLDVSSDPLLSGAAFLPPPPPPLDPFLPPPPPLSDPFLPAPPPPLPPPDGRYDDYSPGGRYRDGADSPLSDRSHRSERGYASSGRRGAGRDWSPPRLSRSSYSPERMSERGVSPEPRRRPPPRYVGGHGSDASGPKTSSPLVTDDYGRPPPPDHRKSNYPRI